MTPYKNILNFKKDKESFLKKIKNKDQQIKKFNEFQKDKLGIKQKVSELYKVTDINVYT